GGGARSCASCHRPELAFTDARPRARALAGTPPSRHTPALWNPARSPPYFLGGPAPSLEGRGQMPIPPPGARCGHGPVICGRLKADAGLVGQFHAAFGAEAVVSQDEVAKALAAYVRSLVSPPTRFDAWIEGDAGALSAAEVRGFRLFTGKAGCVLCHAGWRFTDDRLHIIGLPGTDPGRGAVPGGTPGLRAFNAPSLRELAHTTPHMHARTVAARAAAVANYAGGFRVRPGLAPNLPRTLRLTGQEKADLVAFLLSLSSEAPRGKSRGQ